MKNTNPFMAGNTNKNGKILEFLSFPLAYISFDASVAIVQCQIEWSQSTNIDRIQDGVWLTRQTVINA